MGAQIVQSFNRSIGQAFEFQVFFEKKKIQLIQISKVSKKFASIFFSLVVSEFF